MVRNSTTLGAIKCKTSLWLIASSAGKFAIVLVANSLATKRVRSDAKHALLRDLAQNEHDDDVMTMGGDGGDDDVNDDAVS